MDASTSISSSIAALNNEINKEFDENEDWVLVKKQKIIILVPPPSPRSQETQTDRRSKQAKQQRAGESSISKKIKENRLSKIRNNKSSLVPDHSNHLIEMSMLCKSQFNIQNIGVVNVVNRWIKAKNLERKLQSLGGLRKWLASLGLEWFAVVLEMKNLNQYQLVNLTMSKLKDMGIKAVGPRRKLIHAIDILCRPYYSSASLLTCWMSYTYERLDFNESLCDGFDVMGDVLVSFINYKGHIRHVENIDVDRYAILDFEDDILELTKSLNDKITAITDVVVKVHRKGSLIPITTVRELVILFDDYVAIDIFAIDLYAECKEIVGDECDRKNKRVVNPEVVEIDNDEEV